MNTNIVVSLDTRRSKKDNSFPLILRLGHNERTTPISLKISLHKKDWDEEAKKVKNSYVGASSVTRLNNYIQKKKSEAMDIVLKLDEKGLLSQLSLMDVKNRIVSQGGINSFFVFGNNLVGELNEAKRIGTARSYKETLSVLKNYLNKDITFNEINYSFLTKFERHHLSNGNGLNGLAVYMRTIRAIFNKAIKAGIAEKDSYPFEDYSIRTTPTKKRAIDIKYLKKIIELNLDAEHPLFHARNYFVASYMMYGMNFMDMAFMEKSSIINGRVFYRRKKTSKLYDIKITDSLKAILDYYCDSERDLVFPIIKRESALDQDKDVRWARKRYNKKLKSIATECGIEENLTSYVSRHSFATQAMLQQIPLNAISAMLGHSSLKTTEVYIKGLPNNVLDDYNLKVLQL
ncbi:site-specific integrase [soil metagenome]